MSRPNDTNDYNDRTKKTAEEHEKRRVQMEYGKDSILAPDIDRPSSIYTERKNRTLR